MIEKQIDIGFAFPQMGEFDYNNHIKILFHNPVMSLVTFYFYLSKPRHFLVALRFYFTCVMKLDWLKFFNYSKSINLFDFVNKHSRLLNI